MGLTIARSIVQAARRRDQRSDRRPTSGCQHQDPLAAEAVACHCSLVSTRDSRRLGVIDLFCGAGGFSLGFQAAGCDILGAVDVDETAARTYAENIGRLQPDAPPVVLSGDEGNVEDQLDLERLAWRGRPDILIGGPPCQGFSRVGRAKLDSLTDDGHTADPRNEFYRRFLQAADLWKPLAVVMENVPGMLSIGGQKCRR